VGNLGGHSQLLEHQSEPLRTRLVVRPAPGRAAERAASDPIAGFWAGLHLGPVVTGEVGTVKHEIVYLGDTLNTSARIQQACRTYERPFLASADVIDVLELPSTMEAESLGPIVLRGVGSAIELLAISRPGS
jgi:class 3 adenylate cyclase